MDRKFATGNIIRWGTTYWIVADEGDNEKGHYIEVIAAWASNASGRITEHWPKEKHNNMDSLEFVANNVYDFVERGMLRFLDDLAEKKGK